MMRYVVGCITFALLFFVWIFPVNAQIITVDKAGEVVWNVLSESVSLEAPKTAIEVKNVVKTPATSPVQVRLTKGNEKISLAVESDGLNKELDVTEWKSTLVEVEERPQTVRLLVGIEDGKFTLVQKGVSAVTDFPLTIDSKTAKVFVTTGSGDRYVSVFPFQAVESVLRAKVLSNVEYTQKLILQEEENELLYVISGQKELTFFNFYTHGFPVQSKVSALNGSIVSTNEPVWLKVLGYLFG